MTLCSVVCQAACKAAWWLTWQQRLSVELTWITKETLVASVACLFRVIDASACMPGKYAMPNLVLFESILGWNTFLDSATCQAHHVVQSMRDMVDEAAHIACTRGHGLLN